MVLSSESIGKSMLRLLQTPVARKCHKNLMEDQDDTHNILSHETLKVMILYSLLSRL